MAKWDYLLESIGDKKLRRLERSLKSNFDGNDLMQLFKTAKRVGMQVWLIMDHNDSDTRRLLGSFHRDLHLVDASTTAPTNWTSLEASDNTPPPSGQPFFSLHFVRAPRAAWWITSELNKLKFTIELRDD